MAEEITETIRVQLNYPIEQVHEPILYRLIVDYGLIPDIRRADFDEHQGGFIALELSGDKDALQRGLTWLEQRGIMVTEVGMDGIRDWAV